MKSKCACWLNTFLSWFNHGDQVPRFAVQRIVFNDRGYDEVKHGPFPLHSSTGFKAFSMTVGFFIAHPQRGRGRHRTAAMVAPSSSVGHQTHLSATCQLTVEWLAGFPTTASVWISGCCCRCVFKNSGFDSCVGRHSCNSSCHDTPIRADSRLTSLFSIGSARLETHLRRYQKKWKSKKKTSQVDATATLNVAALHWDKELRLNSLVVPGSPWFPSCYKQSTSCCWLKMAFSHHCLRATV